MEQNNAIAMQTAVVKRPNETIGISPEAGEGTLTIMSRRLFNVFMHFSQKDGVQEIYRRPLREVLRYIDYNSNDLDRIRRHLKAMTVTPVVWNINTDAQESWKICGLIGHAEIIKPHKAGLPATLEWSWPVPIKEFIVKPTGSWTKLSLVMHTKLKSGASVALFEICSRYATSPGRKTLRESIAWWAPALNGVSEEQEIEYKYFKRDVLKPAMAEVNMHAEFKVDLIEHKTGNRVTAIQFSVLPIVRSVDVFEDAPKYREDLVENLTRIGIALEMAREICRTHDVPVIEAAISYTEKRAAKKNALPLNNVAAYFKTALKERYREIEKPTKPQAQGSLELIDPEMAQERLRSTYNAHRVSEAYGYWKEVSTDEQKELLGQFLSTDIPISIRSGITNRVLKTKVAQTAFAQWLAMKLWGDVTAEELLKFSLRNQSEISPKFTPVE